MYYDKYPIGHPEKIVKPKQHDKNWFGLIYCKILPPKGLYLPVLPVKQKAGQAHKLIFGLCRSCINKVDMKCNHIKTATIKCLDNCKIKDCLKCKLAKKIIKDKCQQCYNIRNSQCQHTDSERAITGFWTTVEVNKAIEVGYKIIDIYEVHHFNTTSTELWKSYIRKFLKIKLETSPFNCSEEEYRQKAKLQEIELGELKPNPGLRFISKICLNSLWGKFGQNVKASHKEYIDNERDFYSIITNDKVDNLALSFINKPSPLGFTNDTLVYATYDEDINFIKTNFNTNVYIACFTTSHARLRLYNMMELLGNSVCYCDTDSIIYAENEENKQKVKQYLGDSLGEWTDELDGKHMKLFCSAQPKDYGYVLSNNEIKGKVKGFRTSAETEYQMTNENRIKLITGALDSIAISQNTFAIAKSQIFTEQMTKNWCANFDKRVIVKNSEYDFDTVPFGY